jgi:prevent-host-death family protein
MTIMVISEVVMASWSVADAKAKFSEVLETARSKGPQEITRSGKPVAVLVSFDEWKQRQYEEQPKESLVDFLLCPPHDGTDVEFPRMKGKPRVVRF